MTNCDFIGRMKTQANNLKRYRKARGLRQDALGVLISPPLQQSAVSGHERGTRTPDVYQALRYADVLGVTVEQLFPVEPENLISTDDESQSSSTAA